MDTVNRHFSTTRWCQSQPTAHNHLGLALELTFLACIFSVTLTAAEQSPTSTNAPPAAGVEFAALPLRLPLPTLGPGPWPPSGLGLVNGNPPPHLEALPEKKRPDFLAPKGITNMALGKKVTCSVEKIRTGTLAQITDGQKEAYDDHTIEFRRGMQWVQIDLEQECSIYALLLWHDFRRAQVFHDVIVQASQDPEFKTNVHTLFNNDRDNSSGLGAGTAKEYFENHEGKLIDAKGIKTRYLRLYSNGINNDPSNAYQEIEVCALPR